MTVKPRSYQIDTVNRSRALVARGIRRFIIQAPCGSGKTITACMFMQAAVDKGRRCLFIAPARQLVNQCSNKLQEFGLHHGIIMARRGYTPANIQVASKDTLMSRAINSEKISLPESDIVIFDEAHLSLGDGAMKILERYKNSVIIGLTATPARKSGLQPGDFYKGIIHSVPVSQLIREGYLVPARVFAPNTPDLKGVKVSGGDYVESQLAKRMDRPTLVGDIVAHWKRLAQDRQTVVFASSVEHSMHLCQEFLRSGIQAKHIDAETPDDERDRIFGTYDEEGEIHNGKIRVLCNYGVATFGVDFPPVSCAIFARPTKSFVLYMQMAGRVLRAYNGPLGKKTDALILDHAGCVLMHGFPDEDIDWKLDESEKIQDKNEKKRDEGEFRTPVQCPMCMALFSGSPVCPECGHVLKKKRNPKPTHREGGILTELKRGTLSKEQEYSECVRLWHKCLFVCAAKRKNFRVAYGMFKSMTGRVPWHMTGLPNIPSIDDVDKDVGKVFPQYIQ